MFASNIKSAPEDPARLGMCFAGALVACWPVAAVVQPVLDKAACEAFERARRLGRAGQPARADRRERTRRLASPWPGCTRPLCPYPQVATYRGSGDIEDAASFDCR